MTLFKSVFFTDHVENVHSTETVDTFVDNDHASIGINPCSGLPMIDSNSMIDIGGNIYGTCSNETESTFIVDTPSSTDDTYDCMSSFDDSFSNISWSDF